MPELSVIIPTLNAEASLSACLAAVTTADADLQLIVSDGGSTDGTIALAREAGATVITGLAGRGGQLKRGAEAASTPWFLFLHADTQLARPWWSVVQHHMADEADRAAVFRFALDDPAPQARRVERLARWRGRRLGLPYGDQGLLISRSFYDQIGGYRDMPLMEDVDLIKRIGKTRLSELDCDAVTAADRYRRDGWWARPIRNLSCLAAWHLGVPVTMIQSWYAGR